MLEEKRGRNPLNAEQTPRDNEPFEYCPPPAKPQEERWKYPDSDWGLMAKFRSQKQIYDDIFNKEKEYQKRVDTVAAIREENQKMIRDEFQRQKEQYDEAKKQREALDKSRFQAIMGVNSKGSNLLSHEVNISQCYVFVVLNVDGKGMVRCEKLDLQLHVNYIHHCLHIYISAYPPTFYS